MAYRNTITSLKTSDEELEVEYELVSNIEQNYKSSTQYDINNFIAELDERLVKNQAVLDDLNSNIDRLTNHADGFDYAISACSGVLCGFVDSFFVGEFNFEELKADSNKHVNKFVEKYAKLSGWDGNGRLKSAVEFLEKKTIDISKRNKHVRQLDAIKDAETTGKYSNASWVLNR